MQPSKPEVTALQGGSDTDVPRATAVVLCTVLNVDLYVRRKSSNRHSSVRYSILK